MRKTKEAFERFLQLFGGTGPEAFFSSRLGFWFLKGFVFVWANEASVTQSDQDLNLRQLYTCTDKANEGSC